MHAPNQEQTYFCYHCLDSMDGWRIQWCVGFGVDLVPPRDNRLSVSPCGRRKVHAAHTFAERCACYGQNPEVQRRKDAIERSRK